MPEMQADMYLPEYRVTLGAELFVTANSPKQALGIALDEARDTIVAEETTHGSNQFSVEYALGLLFTTVLVEKMEDPEDDDDDGDGDDDAPDDHPRKPKRPGRMGK